MKNHVANCKAKLAPLQMRIQRCDVNIQQEPSTSSTITHSTSNLVPEQPKSSFQLKLSCFEDKEKAMKAELLWTLKSVLSHNSLNSNSDITEVFKTMSGPLVPDEFSLSPSKMMYLITEGLGPYFWEKAVNEAQNSFCSICFDETTNESSQKELQIAVRYWSQAECKVVERHLQTFFLGRAKGEDLHKKILSALDNANLPLRNLLMISCDGPNVNKKVIRLMNESVLEIRSKGLVDIGTCSLHKIHNAFLKGLEELGHEVSDLIISVFHYFDGWPARWENCIEIQCKVGVANHRFIKHVPSRWLTIGPACERLLEQWDALVRYFLKHVPLHAAKEIDTSKYKGIVQLIKEPTMKAQIMFVIESVKFFTVYSKYFQLEGPMIQCLYDQGKELLLKLRSKVYKPEDAGNFSEDSGSLLPLKDIYFNEELSKELKTLKDKDA